MFPVCRTPPRSDLFDAPERSRLIVVSLFPKAVRKANGNSTGSNGALASSETASSISTAFIPLRLPPPVRTRSSRGPVRLDKGYPHQARQAPRFDLDEAR